MTELRTEFAERAILVAEKRRRDAGWSVERTVAEVRQVAEESAEDVARSLIEAAEMGLDLWAVGP